MSRYDSLVNALISRAPTVAPVQNVQKLSVMLQYAQRLFGGKVSMPSIVVAGTKGKGSTAAVAESVLRHNGLKTGLFTSPHLATPRERLRLDGRSISEAKYVDLYEYLERLLKKNGLEMPPFFAAHTLMAGLLFRDTPVDAAVIECGVGGRYDWTKIFTPKVTAIAALGHDHLQTLGTTPESISWHKFGICLRSSLNFTTVQLPAFHKALMAHSSESGIPISVVPATYEGEMGLHGPCAGQNTALGTAVARALLLRVETSCSERIVVLDAKL
jgi:folylpolyglutamate synthase/dihydrofolate synthase